jgi:rRNA-processing protein FCF1
MIREFFRAIIGWISRYDDLVFLAVEHALQHYSERAASNIDVNDTMVTLRRLVALVERTKSLNRDAIDAIDTAARQEESVAICTSALEAANVITSAKGIPLSSKEIISMALSDRQVRRAIGAAVEHRAAQKQVFDNDPSIAASAESQK